MSKDIASVGKHIILDGDKLVEEGTLIKLSFDFKNHSKHRFGDYQESLKNKKFIGIAHVISIVEYNRERYKILIRMLDLKYAV